MKKFLALLLTAMMVTGFAACNSAEPTKGDATDPATTEITTAAEITSEQPTTEPTTSEEETTAAEEGLADPTGLSKAELVEWYNERLNHVRSAKPKISREAVHRIDKFETTLLGGVADGIINNLVEKNMPGDPEFTVTPKGKANNGEFLSTTATSNVRASDVTSITAHKEGDNYLIAFSLGEETNSAKDGASKYSRVFNIVSAKEVMDGVAPVGIVGDPSNATLVYSNGKVTVTVNPQGEIIKATTYSDLVIYAKQVKVSAFKFDLTVYEQSYSTYSGFVY